MSSTKDEVNLLAYSEFRKAMEDMVVYGVGLAIDGKHIHLEDIYTLNEMREQLINKEFV